MENGDEVLVTLKGKYIENIGGGRCMVSVTTMVGNVSTYNVEAESVKPVPKPKHGWYKASSNSEDYWVDDMHKGYIVQKSGESRVFVYPDGLDEVVCVTLDDAKRIVEKFA